MTRPSRGVRRCGSWAPARRRGRPCAPRASLPRGSSAASPRAASRCPPSGSAPGRRSTRARTPSARPLKDVLERFLERGGRVIDSSPMYGAPSRVVGDLAKELGQARHPSSRPRCGPGARRGRAADAHSLQRMRRRRMDSCRCTTWWMATHLATLREWKAAGRIRYVGVTHYLLSAFDELEGC